MPAPLCKKPPTIAAKRACSGWFAPRRLPEKRKWSQNGVKERKRENNGVKWSAIEQHRTTFEVKVSRIEGKTESNGSKREQNGEVKSLTDADWVASLEAAHNHEVEHTSNCKIKMVICQGQNHFFQPAIKKSIPMLRIRTATATSSQSPTAEHSSPASST